MRVRPAVRRVLRGAVLVAFFGAEACFDLLVRLVRGMAGCWFPRVKQLESDQIVEAMQEKNIPVVYVLFPDEGHGFARPENNMAFNAVTEVFLAKHLGGRFEPIGDDFEGSSIEIPAGKSVLPAVSTAIGTGSDPVGR